MNEATFRINLLFYPERMQEVAQAWQNHAPAEDLLQRNLNTPDWTIAQLSEVAIYHHIRQEYTQAMAYYKRILEWTEQQPEIQGEIMGCVAHVFWKTQQFKDAVQTFELALRLNPLQPRLFFFLSECYLLQGDFGPSVHFLRVFLERYRVDDELSVTGSRQLATLLDRLGDAAGVRAAYAEAAQRFMAWAFALQAELYQPLLQTPEQPLALPSLTPEPLPAGRWWGIELAEWYPYRHLDQHPDPKAMLQIQAQRLQQELYRTFPPQAPVPRSGSATPRIVVIGNLGRPEASLYLDAILALARQRSVTVINVGEVPALLLQEDWLRLYPVNERLDEMRQAIVSQSPDLLLYLDAGPQSPLNLQLAAYPLAPVQAVWGAYPVTTGMPTIQHFLSFDWLEPAEAEDHYTEKLVRLPGMPARSSWMPDRFLSRDVFKLPSDQRTYLCPLSITSVTPAFAAILAEILARDTAARVLIQGYFSRQIDTQFFQFFRATYPEQAGRLFLLPSLTEQGLFSLIREVDLVLDPIANGITHAAWPLLLLGTPVLTWTGPYARGRYLSSLYRELGLMESVVADSADYATRAVELAQRPELKAHYREQVALQRGQLFQHERYMQALNQWLDSVLLPIA
ncbi:MAG: hypothetical protein ACO1RX_18240 [Candidatus Sericytochromatia bacterium]